MFAEDLVYIYIQRYIHMYASRCKENVKEVNEDVLEASPNNSKSNFSYNLKKSSCRRAEDNYSS